MGPFDKLSSVPPSHLGANLANSQAAQSCTGPLFAEAPVAVKPHPISTVDEAYAERINRYVDLVEELSVRRSKLPVAISKMRLDEFHALGFRLDFY